LMAPRALVIGIGNPLRGDDGLGWEAIRLLERDSATARADLREATAHGRSLAALVQAIVASESFQKRVKTGPETTTAARASDLIVQRTGAE